MVLDKTLPPILVGRLLDLPDLPYWWVNSWTYLTSLIGGSTPGLTWTPIRCQTPCHHTLHDSWTFVARLPVIVHSMTPGLTWTPIRCQTPCHHALHDTWTHLDSHSLPDSLSSCTPWLTTLRLVKSVTFVSVVFFVSENEQNNDLNWN